MKNIIKLFSIATLGLTIMSSCIKEIDPQSDTVTKDQAANAPGSFDKFVDAIESSMCGKFGYWPAQQFVYDYGYPSFMLIFDVMGQDIAVEDGNEHYTTWYGCGTGLGPQYAVCQMPWSYYYSWIKSCNTIISLAGEEPASDKRAGAGIAYAMRAFYYMDLARMYSPKSYAFDKNAETVPMVLETTALSDLSNNPRATNEVMWNQIISDLDKAEQYIADYKRSNVYTPDLSVVYGLKARAYLTMENWAKAEEYAKKAQSGYTIMSGSQYLSKTNGFNTPNSSWMLGVTFRDDDPCILENDGDCSWGSQMILEVLKSGMGYAANYGTPKRIDAHLYQTIPETDFRKMCFVDFAIDDLEPAEAIEKLSAYSDVPDEVYTTGTENTASGIVGGLQLKFRPKNGEHQNQYAAWTVAVPLMRVEEMMLIEAEAAGMQQESRGIALLTAFAQSRDPEFEYGRHGETYGSNYANSFQNEVWWQRRVELWGEGFGLFDIKRLDKGVIRSYPGSNHPDGYKWNIGGYTSNDGNNHPDWMDFCIIQTETNYNTACTNNRAPQKPTSDSPEYNW